MNNRIKEYYDNFSNIDLSHGERKSYVDKLTEQDMRDILHEACELWISKIEDALVSEDKIDELESRKVIAQKPKVGDKVRVLTSASNQEPHYDGVIGSVLKVVAIGYHDEDLDIEVDASEIEGCFCGYVVHGGEYEIVE